MKNYQMKKLKKLQSICFTLALIFIFNISFSQTIHKDYLDGHIWIKLKNNVPLIASMDITSGAQKNNFDLDINDFPFLNSALKNINVSKFSRPYFMVSDEQIKNVYRIEFTDHYKVDDIIKNLSQLDCIEYAEKIPFLKKTLTPNDPSFNSSNAWGLYQIQADAAWNVSTGNANVVVAIVDDAVEITHSDLSASIWNNPGEIPNNGIDDDNNGYIDDVNGFDVADSDNDPNPDNPVSSYDHGTHVAGIAGATTDNNTGIASIGFGISLLPVKATNSATGVTHGYDGIVYAVNAGADVINMSWGGSGSSTTGQNIINWANNQNIVLVAAAGNDDVSTIFYPAGYTNVIAVASTTVGDAKSGFSNYGTWIDISAPGSAILSTIPGNGYAVKQGTSMASPMVAGLCGLMLSLNPTLPPSNIKSCLLSSADNIDAANSSYVGELGAGRINALAAMNCISATLNLSPVADFSANMFNILEGQSINFNDLSTYNPQSWSWTFSGGTPATFSGQNPPAITYNTAGTYDVSLTVTNANGNDSEIKSAYITVNSLTGCDTISNTVPNDQILTWTWGAPNGFIGGHNFIKPKSIADKFSGLGPTNIMGSRFFFTRGETNDPNAFITITVWEDNAGQPGNIVYTEDVLIEEIENNINGAGAGFFFPTNVNFDTPVAVSTNDFYIGYQITYSAGDTVSCALTENLNTNNARPNTMWYYIDPADDPLNTGGGWMEVESLTSTGSQWSMHAYPRITQTPPTAVLSANDPVCVGEFLDFDGSTSPNTNNWDWIINGTSTSNPTGSNPSVIMSNAGAHTAYLIAYNACGFYHVDSLVVNVDATPTLNVSASQTTICPGGSSNLNVSGANSYLWTPATSLNSNNISNPVATPSGTTTYNVTGTTGGCSNDASITIIVDDNAPSANLIADNDTICEGETLNLNGAISTNTNTYNWSFNGGDISNSTSSNPSVLYNSAGTYTYTLTVENTCSQTDSVSDQVVVMPASSSYCNSTSGINENSILEDIIVFKTQDNTKLNVLFNNNFNKQTDLYIVSIAGKTIFKKNLDLVKKGDIVGFDISSISEGMYMVNIISESSYESIKFIK